ncbi:DUF4381 domain-containing protein [Bordetella petrii]|uniref:DUF4381 domain-containing protein n=1 Tax=Bordetella petrii TaxID=94624 RepID=UPI001E30FA67|nr:DUF4381 domain-containing protein [Bordetella petrii]MCD0506161.1 DUF4381 domain-containing protein [Bordetella petrii]
MSDASMPGLDQLRELPLPPPVPYWPLTWGWALVAALLLLALCWSSIAYVRRRRRNLYRRQALRELDNLARQATGDPLAARALPALLKRTALAAHPPGQRASLASLRGDAWLHSLETGARDVFPADSASLLATLAYAPDAKVRGLDAAVVRGLIEASRRWMERHHVEA